MLLSPYIAVSLARDFKFAVTLLFFFVVLRVEDMGNPEKVAEAAKKAFTGAKYIISSGGAPRKDGMTREDLLKGNCKIVP